MSLVLAASAVHVLVVDAGLVVGTANALVLAVGRVAADPRVLRVDRKWRGTGIGVSSFDGGGPEVGMAFVLATSAVHVLVVDTGLVVGAADTLILAVGGIATDPGVLGIDRKGCRTRISVSAGKAMVEVIRKAGRSSDLMTSAARNRATVLVEHASLVVGTAGALLLTGGVVAADPAGVRVVTAGEAMVQAGSLGNC